MKPARIAALALLATTAATIPTTPAHAETTVTRCVTPGPAIDREVAIGRFRPTWTEWTIAGLVVRIDATTSVGRADYVRARGTLVRACQVSVLPTLPRS